MFTHFKASDMFFAASKYPNLQQGWRIIFSPFFQHTFVALTLLSSGNKLQITAFYW